MEYSDFDLIRGIKSGDRSALDILIRRWYSRIYGYTFKMIGHEQDAYDITQDVFVAVIQNIGSYRLYCPMRLLCSGHPVPIPQKRLETDRWTRMLVYGWRW